MRRATYQRKRRSSSSTGFGFEKIDLVTIINENNSPSPNSSNLIKNSSSVPASSFNEIEHSSIIAGFTDDDGKLMIVKQIIHASDLSGQTLPFQFAKEWGRRVILEFTNQAKIEASKKIPITVPLINNELEFAKSQSFFIGKICIPLWKCMKELMPSNEERLITMENNKKIYDDQIQEASNKF